MSRDKEILDTAVSSCDTIGRRNMGNPGGDGDGTVTLPFCPYCKPRRLFFDHDEMVAHIARHEGGARKPKTGEALENLLKGKL